MKQIQHLLTSIVLAGVASVASAATVRVDFDATMFDTRYDAGHDAGIAIKYGSTRETVSAGMFSGTASQLDGVDASVFVSANDFYAYCYDLAEHVYSGARVTYTVRMDGEQARTLDFLGAVNYRMSLDTGVYDPYAWLAPTSGEMGAAIQLGIWESLYDTSRNWSNANGGFQATSGVNTGTATWLAAFYGVLSSSDALDGRYVMTLVASGAQDMLTGARPASTPADLSVTASEVPEPASLALVGLALAGLAAARRRKA